MGAYRNTNFALSNDGGTTQFGVTWVESWGERRKRQGNNTTVCVCVCVVCVCGVCGEM